MSLERLERLWRFNRKKIIKSNSKENFNPLLVLCEGFNMFNGQISEVTYGNVFLTVSPVAASCEGNGEQEDAQEGRGQHSQ